MSTLQTVSKKTKKAIPATGAKKATKAKTVSKVAPKVATTKVAVNYVVIGRPGAGSLLKAHTAAMFQFLGMITPSRKTALLSHVRQLWGDTAIGYHTRLGNVVKKDGTIGLSVKGYNFFTDRQKAARYDETIRDGYLAIMKGKEPAESVRKIIGGYKVSITK